MGISLRGLAKQAYGIANRGLAHAGLRLVRKSSPPRSVRDFYEHLKERDYRPSLVVDIERDLGLSPIAQKIGVFPGLGCLNNCPYQLIGALDTQVSVRGGDFR